MSSRLLGLKAAAAATAVVGGGATLASADSGLPRFLHNWLIGDAPSTTTSSSLSFSQQQPNANPGVSEQPGRLLVWGGPFGRVPRAVDSLGASVTSVAAGPHFAAAVTGKDGHVHIVRAGEKNDGESNTVDSVTTSPVEGLQREIGRTRPVAVAARSHPPSLVVLDERGRLHETDVAADGTTGEIRRVDAPAAQSVSCGTGQCIALARDGRRAFVWGSAEAAKGAAASGARSEAAVSTVTAPSGGKLVQACAGGGHTVMVDTEGHSFGAGNDSSGQLGRTREPWLGSAENKNRALGEVTQLADLPVTSVAAGAAHSAFVLRDGRVLACGANRFGQTGHSNYASLAPVAAPADPGGRTVAVFAGGDVTCVLRERARGDGPPELLCVGANERGQLGVGTREVTRSWRKMRYEGKAVRPTAVDVGGIVVAAVVPEERLANEVKDKSG